MAIGTKVIAGVTATLIAGGSFLAFTGVKTIDDAKAQLTSMKETIVAYDKNENELLGKFNTLKSDATAKIDVANQNIDAKNKEIETLQATETELRNYIDQLNAQIKDTLEKYDNIRNQLIETSNRLDVTEKELAAKKAELANLQAEKEQLEKTLASTKEKLAKTEEQLKLTTSERNTLERRLAHSEKEKAELEKQKSNSDAEVKLANKKAAELQETLNNVQKETQNLKPKTEQVQQANTDLAEVKK